MNKKKDIMIDGVRIEVKGIPDITADEIRNHISYVVSQTKTRPTRLVITAVESRKVRLDYFVQGEKFERIRRITGYLVGTIDRWNNAKKAEEKERVKHGLK